MTEIIKCPHCRKENVPNDHACIYQLLDCIAQEVMELKEGRCGNSGKNWYDFYEYLKGVIIKKQ